jgi:hypothetical protein
LLNENLRKSFFFVKTRGTTPVYKSVVKSKIDLGLPFIVPDIMYKLKIFCLSDWTEMWFFFLIFGNSRDITPER